MWQPRTLALAALLSPLFIHVAVAQAPAGAGGSTSTTSQSCGWSSQCEKTSPCCTEFGYCGAGPSCLAGCNPQGSYGSGYCAPLPVCSSNNYTFSDTSRIQTNHTAWTGDTSKFDFTLDTLDTANNSIVQDGELVLSLTENGGGTKISTTTNLLYGTIQANMKTVGAKGVVTAFITMSGVKDEIDVEFVNNTNQVQSNYFWEGDVGTYDHGGIHTAKNRDTTYHTYGVNWTPTQIQWTVDGTTVRTQKKSDTTNDRYPQTPSRVQFSVWPAGVTGASQGTIDWAGGMIDWNASEYTSRGYFATYIKWISIDCYSGSDLDLPYVASNQSSNSTSSRMGRRDESSARLWERANTVNSYVWGANDTNGQIAVSGSNAATVINSPYSTGQNMLVKNGDTKGVTTTSTSKSATDGLLGNGVVGSWWNKLGTPARVGIIIGACAVALFILVAICTICARARDRKKQAAVSASAKDNIPLVRTGGGGGAGAGDSTADLPGRFQRQQSDYADSINSTSKNSYRAGGGGRNDTPPVPSVPQHYQQQQYNYGGGGGGGGGGYGQQGAYGGYPQQYARQQQHPQAYGAYDQPQQYQQQWQGYGSR